MDKSRKVFDINCTNSKEQKEGYVKNNAEVKGNTENESET